MQRILAALEWLIGIVVVGITVFAIVVYPLGVYRELSAFSDFHKWPTQSALVALWIMVPAFAYWTYRITKKGLVCPTLILLMCSIFSAITVWADRQDFFSRHKVWEGECGFVRMAAQPKLSRLAVVVQCGTVQVWDSDGVLRAALGKVPENIHCTIFAAGNHACTAE